MGKSTISMVIFNSKLGNILVHHGAPIVPHRKPWREVQVRGVRGKEFVEKAGTETCGRGAGIQLP